MIFTFLIVLLCLLLVYVRGALFFKNGNLNPRALWKYDAGFFAETSNDFYNGLVYLKTANGLVAVDAKTGQEINNYPMQFNDFAFASCLEGTDFCVKAINGDDVYLSGLEKDSPGKTVIIDKNWKTGEEKWRVTNNGIERREVFLSSDGDVYTILTDTVSVDNLVKLNKETGAEIWRQPLKNADSRIMFVSDKNVYLFGRDTELISAFNSQTGIKLWTIQSNSEEVSLFHLPQIVGRNIQLIDGTLIDEITGKIDNSQAQPMIVNNQILDKVVTSHITYNGALQSYFDSLSQGNIFPCIDSCPRKVSANDNKTGKLLWNTPGYEFQINDGVVYIQGEKTISAVK